MSHSDAEVAVLSRRIARLTEEARKNEESWKLLQRCEMAFLEAEQLPELFEHLTAGLGRAYGLQATSVAIADPDHETRNLVRGQGKDPDGLPRVLFVNSVGTLVPALRAGGRPWLGAFDESLHRRLFPSGVRVASLALLPLVRHRQIIASLHFASDDRGRFTEAHATDFLSHLASMAAFGLESAVNRARLVQRGFTDALTGWHNRSYLDARLQEELTRSQRDRMAIGCLMLDVDHFKRVNDEHGHAAGDTVLREIAHRIGAEVRASDISARYGGEEFMVLLPRTQLETGRLLAERIRIAVSARPFGIGVLAEPLAVTVSIGLAEYRPDGSLEDAESAAKRLIARADRALYRAKAAGRNAVALAAA